MKKDLQNMIKALQEVLAFYHMKTSVQEKLEKALAELTAAEQLLPETTLPGTDVLHIYTDGACSGNPGPGGWAYILHFKDQQGNVLHSDYNHGRVENTTNNQMELTAVLYALRLAHAVVRDIPTLRPQSILVHTDSKNVIGWLQGGWKRNNQDIRGLCESIEDCHKHFQTIPVYTWTKGHAGDPMNERVNTLAQQAIKERR